MYTNLLDQLKGICEQALSSVAKLNKSFKKFIIETMICYLSITGRVNFSQMARFSTSCESRFRQNFKKRFDWVKFNTAFASPSDGHLRAIAIDPCFIPKSGKKTPGLGYFWSGTANAAKTGLEILGMALVDAVDDGGTLVTLHYAKLYAVCLKRIVGVVIAVYDDPEKKTQTRKVFFSTDLTLSGEQIYLVYRSRFSIEFLYRDGKQFTSLTGCQARNRKSLNFAFNASLSSVNIAKALARELGLDLSVESVKLLTHNAVMIQRIISTFAKSLNLN